IKFPMLRLPVRLGPEIAWFYNSQDSTPGPLGPGTSTSLSWKTYQDANYKWWIIAPGHRRYRFDSYYDWTTGTTYYRDVRDPEMLGVKFIQGANDYNLAGELYLKDGTQFQFGYYGDLTRILDRYGNFVDVSDSGFPTAVSKGGTYYPRIDFTYT